MIVAKDITLEIMFSIRNFYRFVNSAEKQYIIDNRRIQSVNPRGTYYTPNRYEDPTDAQKFLSLRYIPQNRVGPIPNYVIPVFDVVRLRIVPPAHGQPGGGYEACTRRPVYLFGIYNFNSNQFEM